MFSPTVRKAINYRVTQAQAFERAALLHASLIAADEETKSRLRQRYKGAA